jgi:hypothetical protein
MSDTAPPRGLVGVGIGGLSLEAVVVLLATPAVTTAERGHVVAWHVGYLLGLALVLIMAAVLLRRPYGLYVGSLVQPLVILAGLVTWPMYVVGLLFTVIWIYYLRLWRAG